MNTCQGCGGSVRSDSKSGYCTKTPRCRAENKASTYRRGRGDMPHCKGCGCQLDRDNMTGYCQKTQLCHMNSQNVYHGRPEISELRHCKSCGKQLRSDNETDYCAANPDCALSYHREKRVSRESEDGYQVKRMWSSASYRAKAKGIPFTITHQDIEDVWVDECPVFGFKFYKNRRGIKGASHLAPSLDRIIPALGYVPGNIQILSWRANLMKNNATPDELLQFAAWIEATYGAQQGGD